MFCPNCGNEIATGRVFCGKCGARLNAAAASAAQVDAVAAAPVSPPPPPSPYRWAVYAGLLVLAALIGAGWWWFHRPAPPYEVKDPGIYPVQGLSADGKSQKWGFMDADGKVLIQPEWDQISTIGVSSQMVAFNEGLCGVEKDGKWGYIDPSGNLTIPAQFDGANPFIEGLARVKLGNQFGYIDKKGQYVITPQFYEAGDFHGGLAAVHADGGWGFINKSGTFVMKPHFQSASVDGFSEDRAIVCDPKCGYIDGTGAMIIHGQFEGEQSFAEGLAAVQIANKWGFIDRSGKIVINPQFDQALPFAGGLAVVSVAGHGATINKQGKFVVNPGQFDFAMYGGHLLLQNIQTVSTKDGVGVISRDGNWLLHPTVGIAGPATMYGKVLYVGLNGQSLAVSTSGKVLAGPYKGAMLDSLAQDMQNEDSALMSVHGLIAAEASYSAAYPAAGFTASLDKLGPATGAADENHAGLIAADLATGTKDGYQFTVTIPAGTSTGGTNFNYFLVAKPASGHTGSNFCADSSGVVRHTAQGEECTATSPATLPI